MLNPFSSGFQAHLKAGLFMCHSLKVPEMKTFCGLFSVMPGRQVRRTDDGGKTRPVPLPAQPVRNRPERRSRLQTGPSVFFIPLKYTVFGVFVAMLSAVLLCGTFVE